MKDALDLLDRHRDPLQSTRLSRLSFAALLVLTAQDIRDEGLPDWMQVIVFTGLLQADSPWNSCKTPALRCIREGAGGGVLPCARYVCVFRSPLSGDRARLA